VAIVTGYGDSGFPAVEGPGLPDGYKAALVMEGPLLIHGEGEKDGFPVAGCFSLSPSPIPSLLLLETLAAAMALPPMFSSRGC
jgi:hypothetical protein